jgi:hypothetical protein
MEAEKKKRHADQYKNLGLGDKKLEQKKFEESKDFKIEVTKVEAVDHAHDVPVEV